MDSPTYHYLVMLFGQLQNIFTGLGALMSVAIGVIYYFGRKRAREIYNSSTQSELRRLTDLADSAIKLKNDELRHLKEYEDKIVGRILTVTESYTKELEDKLEQLKIRVDALELENRQLHKENISLEKYVTLLQSILVKLGISFPERTSV